MADTKTTALGAVTPELTDIMLIVDDPGGTPVTGRVTLTALQTLLVSTAGVTSAGALMDSEVTNLPDVKSFEPADYATAAQGSTADTALQPGGALGTPSSGTLTNCDGLPVAGLVGSTSTAVGVGSIELGHASDTTLARIAAGRVSIEGAEIATLAGTQTLTNKTLTAPGTTRGWLTSVSGSLDAATHSGRGLVTSGNVTVPTTEGFNAVIKAGGAHTVTFNSTTSAAMATGDVMTVEVQSSTIINAVLTPAASLVAFS